MLVLNTLGVPMRTGLNVCLHDAINTVVLVYYEQDTLYNTAKSVIEC